MNEEQFNMELRKFLKRFGVGAQREIEQTAQEHTGPTLKVRAVLTIEGVGDALVQVLALTHVIADASPWQYLLGFAVLEVVVALIAGTTTETGLKVKAAADQKTYRTGIKVTDAEIKALNQERETFHGEWNYTIKPRQEETRETEH